MQTTKMEMEARLIACLHSRPATNADIRAALAPGQRGYVPEIDRALQRLRKAGRIHLVGRAWALAAVRECPMCGGAGIVRE